VDPSDVRALNASIAEGYDAVPYEMSPPYQLDPDLVAGFAALYGSGRPIRDVLDLGCGSGLQLARAGEQAGGRLVGADLSAAAVALARSRCERFGARVDIRHADLLDLTPEALGQFDLIYNLGVIYVVPPEVRAHLLRLISQCLRPGGVAVISYFAGGVPMVRLGLYALLHAAADRHAPPARRLEQVRGMLERVSGDAKLASENPALSWVARQTANTKDDILFHEIFDRPHAEVLSASALHGALVERGVNFLNTVSWRPAEPPPTSRERALACDLLDLPIGGYRYGVFAAGKGGSFDPCSRAVLWRTGLRRAANGRREEGRAVFEHQARDAVATTSSPVTEALLDELVAGPRTWSDALPAALRRLGFSRSPDDPQLIQGVRTDLVTLWGHQLVEALAAPNRKG